MALNVKLGEVEFGVGDEVAVHQKIKEGEKERTQVFEGMVIKIRGRGENKSFTVRRVGAQKIGIERIFPLESPVIEKIEVSRSGTKGVKRSKLYYTRGKSARDIEQIYARAKRREEAKQAKPKPKRKVKAKKKALPKKMASKKTSK